MTSYTGYSGPGSSAR